MNEVKINSIYRHYKGNYYYIKDIAYDCESLEKLVIYQALYGDNRVWVRKLSCFLQEIDIDKSENIYKQKHRFELINLNKEEI